MKQPDSIIAIPQFFCWTKFGVEASEFIENILARKEMERLENSGRFLWGIGNAVLNPMKLLVSKVQNPELLFSPIASRPRPRDVSPKAVVAWRSGVAADGAMWEIPVTHLCTSGFDPARPARAHYALVCSSDQPLAFSETGFLVFPNTLRNLASGIPLGASQVTAIVEYDRNVEPAGRSYQVALRNRLVPPYCVRLVNPVIVPSGYTGSTRQEDWTPAIQNEPVLFSNA